MIEIRGDELVLCGEGSNAAVEVGIGFGCGLARVGGAVVGGSARRRRPQAGRATATAMGVGVGIESGGEGVAGA